MSAVATKPLHDRRAAERRIRSTCGVFVRDGRRVHRTPALEDRDADWFAEHGFSLVQSLVLLGRECRPDATSDLGIESLSWRKLRSRRNADLRDSLLALDAVAFAAPWNLSADALALACEATSEHVVLVLRGAGAALSGFAVVGRSATSGYLQRLAVHPAARRRGVATRLVRGASAWAESRGADTLFVNTEKTNDAALALYSRLGFSSMPQRLSVLERPVPASS